MATNRPYRPAGPLRWLLEKFSANNTYDFIGALAAEDRSTSALEELALLNCLNSESLILINDEPSQFSAPVKARCDANLSILQTAVGKALNVHEINLFDDVDVLEEIVDAIGQTTGEHVVLDISSMPKRVFFYILRRLIEDEKIKTLIATYSSPKSYGAKLHINPGGWMPLPSFGSQFEGIGPPLLVVAVGYFHLNLIELIHDREPRAVKFLFPFPSPPPGNHQNWEFVRHIGEQVTFSPNDIRRVDPLSASLPFDHLVSQCSGHTDEVILAPFGPKPISLAMAVFALERERMGLPVSVGYTQPKAYSDNYSIGTRRNKHGDPAIHAFCLKINGNRVFSIGN